MTVVHVVTAQERERRGEAFPGGGENGGGSKRGVVTRGGERLPRRFGPSARLLPCGGLDHGREKRDRIGQPARNRTLPMQARSGRSPLTPRENL